MLRLLFLPKIATGVFIILPDRRMDIEFHFPHRNEEIFLHHFLRAEARIIPGKFSSVELTLHFSKKRPEVLLFKPSGGRRFFDLPKENIPVEVIHLMDFMNKNLLEG